MAIKLIPSTNDLNNAITQINTNLLELKNNEVTTVFKDDTGTRRVMLGKGADGFYGIKVSKVGSDVYSASDDDLIFSSSFNNEKSILMNYWFGSYKLSSSWTDLNGSYTVINFDDWNGYSWYYEAVYFTDAGTGSVRLYNVTDGEAVDGTTFSTTSTGEANAVYSRSEVLTKYSGTKVFKTQVKIDGGNGTTQYVNCMSSKMIFRTGE